MSIDLLLLHYGLISLFLLMLIKSVGVPFPIPADVIVLTAAAFAAQGKLVLWQVFIVALLALVGGGVIQFMLARGPARRILYRFGRSIGLTPARLDAASARVQKGGIFGIGLTFLIPGVRGVAIIAAGLAKMPLITFTVGLLLGCAIFLCLHLFLGYLGGAAIGAISRVLPSLWVIIAVLAMLVIVYALWVVAARWQKAARAETEAASLEVWHEGICPVCLALYTANQLVTRPGEANI